MKFPAIISLALVSLPSSVVGTSNGNGNGNGNGNSAPAPTAPAPAPTAPTGVPLDGVCKLELKNGNNKYEDVAGFTCAYTTENPLQCEVENYEGNPGEIVTGVCKTEKCTGKAVEKTHPKDSQATDRVTICHRTCSEKNPWVRITIDKDAWGNTYRGSEDNGTSGCGHQLQHDVVEDCPASKHKYPSPESKWYPYWKDYLIADWGKKDAWSAQHWREWEPACPYVRRGQCCEIGKWFDRGDGVYVAECCGDYNATDYPLPTPAPVAPPTPPGPTPPAPTPPAPTPPAPTPPAPTPVTCAYDMGKTGSTMCPNVNVVKSLDVKGPTPPSTDIIYDIKYVTDPVPLVKFKVDNPFNSPADIYVEYHEDVGTQAGSFDAVCKKELLVPGCRADASEITAACLAPEGKTPFSVVRIYFVSTDSGLGGGSSAHVPECCDELDRQPGSGNGYQIVEYTYEILCSC